MAKQRKREYIDVWIKESEIKRLKKGFTVHRWNCNKSGVCIAIKMTDRKVVNEITKLKARIKELQKQAHTPKQQEGESQWRKQLT